MQVPALASGFLGSAERFPAQSALEVGGEVITYEDLRRRAFSIASKLSSVEVDADPPLTAVFAARSATAFAAVLGVLLRGHGYVPLNPRYPIVRNRLIVERAGCRTIVADPSAAGAARELVDSLSTPLRVVVPDDDRARAEDVSLPEARADDPAYLLFTSGSTGTPKGVAVSHANARAFLDAITDRYAVTPDDRLSQSFDLTFDLSVFDMFVAWENGACVCCPDPKQLLKASDFIRDSALTVWFSVPSIAMFLQRLGALKPGAFPSLRLSLFCGEALPTRLAEAWARAAPESTVDNLYGPTEATIACTAQRWDGRAADRALNGLVPIGRPFGETSTRVVDESLEDVPRGTPGQLLLGGRQVVGGYWRDDAATSQAFVDHPELGHSYLTGDRVVELDSDGALAFLGRLDSQIKLLGHRVELGEVEAAIREEAAAEAVAVGWPRTDTGAAGIVAFVESRSLDLLSLRNRLASHLPDYMVPRELRLLPELPVTANGKRDRFALFDLLEAED